MRQLQDACRDARDDARDAKEENKRLQAVIESMKQDAWRSAIFNEPRGGYDASAALIPPSAAATGHYRPTLPPPFTIPTAGMGPPSGSRTQYSAASMSNEASSSRQPFTSLMSAFTHTQGNERVGDWLADGAGSTSPTTGLPTSINTHSRSRMPSSSRSPPLSPLPPTKFLSDMGEAQIDTPPSFGSGSLSPTADNQSPPLTNRSQVADYPGMSMFGHALSGHGSLDFDGSRMNPSWSPMGYSPGTPSFPTGLSGDIDDYDLSRPDTVRVSHYASGRRDARAYGRASPGLRAPGSQSSHSRVPSSEQDLHNIDTRARHDLGRSGPPSSTSSPYSQEMSPRDGPSPGPSTSKQPLVRTRSLRHSTPQFHVSDDDDEGEEGDLGGPSPSEVVPFSDTLALVKASAFRTNRKTRTRTRRPGADVAANEVLNALNARGADMGLNVDLDTSAPRRKRSKKSEQDDA